MVKVTNIFQSFDVDKANEIFETLVQTNDGCLERIISHGQVTPPGEWLVSQKNEWVLLLQGSAVLKFKDPEQSVTLSAGDHINIRAQIEHRVEWTDPNQSTIWLALHYDGVNN